MQLLVLGLNHETAPVEVRERFSIDRDAMREGLANIDDYDGLEEAVVLSTCNRSEVYAVLDDEGEGLPTLKQFLFDLTGNDDDIDEFLYSYSGVDCIRHLFRVAASLDSLILGEGQILSQVKDAYTIAREAGATSTVLNTLMHRAIATGKRVRTETRIQYNSVSVSYAAVELAEQELGGLQGRGALIFGAGHMAELTARHLASHGVSHIYVANRHVEKAQKIADEVGGEAIPFVGALRRAADVDIVVTSTGAPHYIVHPWETRKLMNHRHGRPVFIIDIAVPRDVDPEVGDIKGITLYNIDALEEVVDEHKAERQREAKGAEEIVEEEVEELREKFQYLPFQPLMARLSDRCERIREREVRRAASKLPDLTEAEWRQVEHMSHMIVRKILRTPMKKMNAAAGTANEAYYANAMRALFKLDRKEKKGEGHASEAEIDHRYAEL